MGSGSTGAGSFSVLNLRLNFSTNELMNVGLRPSSNGGAAGK